MNLNPVTIQALTDLAAADILSNPSRVLDLLLHCVDNLAPELALDANAIDAVSRVRSIERSRVLSTDVVAKTDCKAAIVSMLTLIPDLESNASTLAARDDYYVDGYLEAMRGSVLELSRYLQTAEDK